VITLENGTKIALGMVVVGLFQTNSESDSMFGRLECDPGGEGAYIQKGTEAHPNVGMRVITGNSTEYGNYGAGRFAPLAHTTSFSRIVAIDPGEYSVLLDNGVGTVVHQFDGATWNTEARPEPGYRATRGRATGWAALAEVATDGEYSFCSDA
jgi:hypothetical protein